MLRARVMPCLLLKNEALVKTIKFRSPSYVGDPVNAIRIFNEKEVDELVLLDISATLEKRRPPFKVLSEIASECFMPLAYGGGVRDIEDVRTIFSIGIEKVILNSYAFEEPKFVRKLADTFGCQSVVICLDVHKNWLGRDLVYTHSGKKCTGLDPLTAAARMEAAGAGELLLQSIDRDGTQTGYDLNLIKRVSSAVNVPVIACGGAGKVADFGQAVHGAGASACAAGSMVVYYGPHRAVLINFPEPRALDEVLHRRGS